MKLKLSTIVNSVENLKALQTKEMPIKVSYKIKRLIDKLAPILKAYEEKRTELIKEYGEEQEDKTLSVTDPEKLKIFFEKLNEVLEIEEEIDFEPIKIEEMGNVVVSPNQLVDYIFE